MGDARREDILTAGRVICSLVGHEGALSSERGYLADDDGRKVTVEDVLALANAVLRSARQARPAVGDARREEIISAIEQTVASCAEQAGKRVPPEGWSVDYAGILARVVEARPAVTEVASDSPLDPSNEFYQRGVLAERTEWQRATGASHWREVKRNPAVSEDNTLCPCGAPSDHADDCQEPMARITKRELSALRARPAVSEAALALDVLRCIPADWKPGYGREWGAHLGNILAEFIDDLRAGRYPVDATARPAVTEAMVRAAYWQHAEENGDRAHPGDSIAPEPDASDLAEWRAILTAALEARDA